jgi:hypothetical protein
VLGAAADAFGLHQVREGGGGLEGGDVLLNELVTSRKRESV